MEEQTLVSHVPDFSSLFPEKVIPDTRNGYSGFIIPKEFLIEFSLEVRYRWG